jgi:hypothetical protein
MPKRNYAGILVAVAFGAVAGWGGSKFAHRPSSIRPVAAAPPEKPTSVQVMPVFSRPLPDSAGDPGSPDYYPDIALWATEASAEDIAQLWIELSEKPANQGRSVLPLLLKRWVELDPNEAVRRLAGTLAGNGEAWTLWARLDPDAALAAARASNRKRSIEWVIRGIAEVNPNRALELVESDPSLAIFVISSIATQLAKAGNYEQALNLKIRYGSTFNSRELEVWAAADPHAAMRWCLAHPFTDKTNRDTVYKTFLDQYPDQANELLAILPDRSTRAEFAEFRMAKLLEKSPETAATFVKSQQDPLARQALAISLGKKIAQTHWEIAADLYRDLAASDALLVPRSVCIHLSDTDHRSQLEEPASRTLLMEMTEKNPAATFQMAEQIAKEKNIPELLDPVVNTWIYSDRFGFSDFLAKQPPSETRDQWSGELALQLVNNMDPQKCDFPSSIAWGISIQNPELRNKILDQSISSWNEKDSDGLRSYLADPKLPKATLDTLGKIINPNHQ